MENKLKYYIINTFEQENYPLSKSIKRKMVAELSYTEIIVKLASMADQPPITKFEGINYDTNTILEKVR